MSNPDESKKSNRIRLAVDIQKDDRLAARRCAKARGMLFESWLGEVIRKAVKEETSAAEDDE